MLKVKRLQNQVILNVFGKPRKPKDSQNWLKIWYIPFQLQFHFLKHLKNCLEIIHKSHNLLRDFMSQLMINLTT